MKYYLIDNESTIKSVFNSLRELREQLDDIDVSDYVDDLDTRLPSGDGIVSDSYIKDILEEKSSGSNGSASDLMDIQVKVNDLEEQLNLFKEENNNVHSEVISLESNLSDTEKILSKTESDKDKVEKSLAEQIKTVNKYSAILKECKDSRASLLVPKAVGILNDLISDIKHSEQEIERFKGELIGE